MQGTPRRGAGGGPAESDPERRQRLLKLAGAGAVAAILAIVVLIVVSQSGDSGGDTDIESADTVVAELEGLAQEGSVVGDPGAPVTVVEFADLQCPVCGRFSEVVTPELLEGPVADGRAKLEFRNWAILGEDSIEAAKAALAAGEQDRMWTFVELFYDNQGIEGTGYVDDAFLEALAEEAGLDMEQWQSDREDPRWDAELKRIDAEAIAAGFEGTPSVLLIGPGGEQPLGTVGSAAAIEDAIAQLGG